MAKVKFTDEFFEKFKKDPRGTFQQYGIEADDEFFRKAQQFETSEQFEDYIRKSRFFSFFDFSA